MFHAWNEWMIDKGVRGWLFSWHDHLQACSSASSSCDDKRGTAWATGRSCPGSVQYCTLSHVNNNDNGNNVKNNDSVHASAIVAWCESCENVGRFTRPHALRSDQQFTVEDRRAETRSQSKCLCDIPSPNVCENIRGWLILYSVIGRRRQ